MTTEPGLTVKGGGPLRRLAECSMEELAVRQMTAVPTGGVLFARSQNELAKEPGYSEKSNARWGLLVHIDDLNAMPHLRFLGMPGIDWKMENKILGRREGDWQLRRGPTRTAITAVENDRAIFHAAATRMPGIRLLRASKNKPNKYWEPPPAAVVTEVLPANRWSEMGLRNPWTTLRFGNVDDLMYYEREDYDVVWLDYTGPMSTGRLQLIADFWHSHVTTMLCVTSLKARWDAETSAAVAAAGGLSALLRTQLPGQVLQDVEYADGPSPMHQLTIRKLYDTPRSV